MQNQTLKSNLLDISLILSRANIGQGMKVAIEVSIAAVETLKIQPYTKIIAVGGTGEGVDTAIVVTTSTQKEAFGKNPNNRLIIHEIIAMPIEKWWTVLLTGLQVIFVYTTIYKFIIIQLLFALYTKYLINTVIIL